MFMSTKRLDSNEHIGYITVAICLYLITIPFDFIPIGTIGSFSKIIVFIPVAACILNLRLLRFTRKSGILTLLLFGVSCTFSSVISPFNDLAISNCYSLLLNLGVTVLFATKRYNRRELNVIKSSVLYSGVAFAIVTLIFNYVGDTGRMGISLFSADQNVNYLCGYLIFPQAICLIQAFNAKKKIKYIAMYMLLISVVFLTGSRGGLLGSLAVLLIALIVYILLRKASWRSKLGLLLLAAVLLIILYLIFVYFVPDELRKRYTFSSIYSDKGSNRILIWESMLLSYRHFDIWQKLFGIGVGVSPLFSYNGKYVAHNAFIAYLLEAGIVGVVIYTGLLISLIIKEIRFKEYDIMAGTVGLALMSMTSNFTNFKPMWVIIFIGIALSSFHLSCDKTISIKNGK